MRVVLRTLVTLAACLLALSAQTTPLLATSPAYDPYVVLFDANTTTLTEEAKAVLDEVVRECHRRHVNRVILRAHYDRSLTNEQADLMTERMALTVREYLIEHSVAENLIALAWLGEHEPPIPTPDGVSEPRNRRVEVILEPY